MNELHDLALSVSRCTELSAARLSTGHPCHKIVSLQSNLPDEFQVPEGWAGNLTSGRVIFVSSNPSISEADDAQSGGSAEVYPKASWPDGGIADFIVHRFEPEQGHARADGTFLRENGTWSKPVAFWSGVRNRATELLQRPADPAVDYAMTEVVHCKSKGQRGVKDAAYHCSRLHLDPVLSASPAPLVVILGAHARDLLQPQWDLPPMFGRKATVGIDEDVNLVTRRLGGIERRITYLWHPSGMTGPKTFAGAYPTRLKVLRELVSAEASVDE